MTQSQRPPEDDPTSALARAARSGSAEHFSELYVRIAPALHVWADLRIRPEHRAGIGPEDVVQEVWCRAFEIFASYDPERPFRYWIFSVAKRVLLENVRALTARRQPVDPSRDRSPLRDVPESVTSISRRVARDETLTRFVTWVRGLPPADGAILVHCGLEGLSTPKVAQRLELGADAVLKRWQRLRKRLRERGLPPALAEFLDVG